MSSSLRDQLVKAGLATAGQAKKAEREQQAKRRGQGGRKGGGKGGGKGDGKHKPGSNVSPAAGQTDETSADAIAKARARQVRAEKASRDRAIAKVRNEKAAEKAKRAEIKQLIAQNDQRTTTASDDDAPYNFKHGKKVKRIYVPKSQVDELSAGRLVIVNNDGRYHIVSKAVAAQISQRDPKWIVAAHDAEAADAVDDEYYKRFEVPDDLDW